MIEEELSSPGGAVKRRGGQPFWGSLLGADSGSLGRVSLKSREGDAKFAGVFGEKQNRAGGGKCSRRSGLNYDSIWNSRGDWGKETRTVERR